MRMSVAIAELGGLSLVEVDDSDASSLAGALFAKHFKQTIPAFPRHFILMSRSPGVEPSAIGYVHHTRDGDAYLAGGLVVEALHFRKLDSETAGLVAQGGRPGGMDHAHDVQPAR
jgi:hypothetical protein